MLEWGKTYELGLKTSSNAAATANIRREPKTGNSLISLSISGEQASKEFFVYTIDKTGKLTKLGSIKGGEIGSFKTKESSFILAVSLDGALKELPANSEFYFVSDAPGNFVFAPEAKSMRRAP
jgi:hypothetical protein